MKRTVKISTFEIRFYNSFLEETLTEKVTVFGNKSPTKIKKDFVKTYCETEEIDPKVITVLDLNVLSIEEKTYKMDLETFINYGTLVG